MDGKIVITADTSQLRSEMQKASDAVRGFEGDAGRRLLDSLQEQVKTFGMTNEQIALYKARMLGVGDEADKLVSRLQHMRSAQAAFSGLGDSTMEAARAMSMLGPQMTDIVTQLAGGQNPMLIMVQQGGQLRDVFGGFGNLFRGVAAAINPVMLGFAGVAGALAGLIFAYQKGTEQSDRFSRSMRLSGDYAGITEGQFNTMARNVADSAETGVGAARDALMQLVETGQLSGRVLQSVGQTALTFARMSNQSAEDVVKDFASMKDGVTKWAEEHNSKYHFLTAAQYEHIATLEREGQTQQAMQATMDAFNEHLRTHAENIGYLESAWNAAGRAMSDFWDKLKGLGRESTIDDQIAALKTEIANAERRAAAAKGTREGDRIDASLAGLRGALTQLETQKDLQESDRKSAALADQLHEKAIRAIKDNEAIVKSMRTRAQQGEDEVTRYLNNQAAIKAAGMNGDSAEKQAEVIAGLRKKFSEPEKRHQSRVGGWEAELEEIKLAGKEKAVVEQSDYVLSKQEEQKFWKDKLALTAAGSKEQAAVRQKVATLGLDMIKEQYAVEQAGYKLGTQAAKDAYDARVIYMQKYVDSVGREYGKDSAQYKAALKEQEAIRQEHEAKLREIDTLRSTGIRKDADAVIDEAQRAAREQFDLGMISREQLLELQRGFIAQKMQLDLQAADYEISLYSEGTLEYERALQKRREIQRKYEAQLSENRAASSGEKNKPQNTLFGSMQTSLEAATTGLLTKTQSWAQAMNNIYKSVGNTFVQELVTKPLAQWAAMWVRKLAMQLGFLSTEQGQEAAAAVTGSFAKKALALSEIMANAGVAASGAFAATAAIPIVGPELAPGAAAAAFAGASSWAASLFSAAGGFDIPRGMNPLTQLHAEEMVLPAKYANGLRDLIHGGATGQGGGAPVVNYNDHSGRLTPQDLRRNAKVIAEVLRDHMKKS